MNTKTAKLSFINTIIFCFKGFRKSGLKEAKMRFEYFWPLHLHKWIGWIYKTPVENYYNKIGITPVAGLMCDISSSNRHSLFYYAYAIRHLIQMPGIKYLLSELASVERAPNEEYSHEGERKYHNLMVELHGCYLVHKYLKMDILDVEYASHKVLSPKRQGNKSCDIKGAIRSNELFFECKDSSAEIVSGQPYRGVTITTPRSDFSNKTWLFDKMQEADDKGADYLIAKIPIWSQYKGIKRIRDWIKSVFQDSIEESWNHFSIQIEENKYKCLKGCYILLRKSAIKLTLKENK